MDNHSRVTFFEKILNESQNASTKGWAALKFLVMLKRKSIEAVSLPSVSESGFEGELIKDDQSSTLYPFDAPKGLTPVKVYGDGNCFIDQFPFHYLDVKITMLKCELELYLNWFTMRNGIQTLRF